MWFNLDGELRLEIVSSSILSHLQEGGTLTLTLDSHDNMMVVIVLAMAMVMATSIYRISSSLWFCHCYALPYALLPGQRPAYFLLFVTQALLTKHQTRHVQRSCFVFQREQLKAK